jgi:hypothetical protein
MKINGINRLDIELNGKLIVPILSQQAQAAGN